MGRTPRKTTGPMATTALGGNVLPVSSLTRVPSCRCHGQQAMYILGLHRMAPRGQHHRGLHPSGGSWPAHWARTFWAACHLAQTGNVAVESLLPVDQGRQKQVQHLAQHRGLEELIWEGVWLLLRAPLFSAPQRRGLREGSSCPSEAGSETGLRGSHPSRLPRRRLTSAGGFGVVGLPPAGHPGPAPHAVCGEPSGCPQLQAPCSPRLESSPERPFQQKQAGGGRCSANLAGAHSSVSGDAQYTGRLSLESMGDRDRSRCECHAACPASLPAAEELSQVRVRPPPQPAHHLQLGALTQCQTLCCGLCVPCPMTPLHSPYPVTPPCSSTCFTPFVLSLPHSEGASPGCHCQGLLFALLPEGHRAQRGQGNPTLWMGVPMWGP